jgi:trk system potassium uptake protein TrkH
MFVLFSVACVALAIVGLTITEGARNASESADQWLALSYEAVSAFGTAGLSTGITGSLTTGGKVIIILLMFVGRVGPLMLAIYLARPAEHWRVRYPKETISLG